MTCVAQGALLQRSPGMCVPTLRCYDLPSPGMRWSVVANGRVTVTLQQLLPWWLLSPVTLRPRGSDSEDSDPSEKGQILNCCLCGTAPAILSTVSYARQPTATRDFLWGFSRWRWRESGDRTTSLLPGVSPPEIPCEGIFFFIPQHSLFLASRPCLTLSVVPSMSPYCSWFVCLMFQTRSLAVSYLSHRCLQISLLCCVCSQTLSEHILPTPVLVRAMFQKHALLACSHLLRPRSKCLLSLPRPVLCQIPIHFPSGVWVQACILLASPHVSCRLPLPLP